MLIGETAVKKIELISGKVEELDFGSIQFSTLDITANDSGQTIAAFGYRS